MEGGYRGGSCTASVICSVVDFPDAPPCEFWIIFFIVVITDGRNNIYWRNPKPASAFCQKTNLCGVRIFELPLCVIGFPVD